MESVVRSVREIHSSEKRCLENALGQQLGDDQQVFIMVFTPNVLPDDAVRREALNNIEGILDEAEKNALARGVAKEEADAAVDEAMQRVRHRKS